MWPLLVILGASLVAGGALKPTAQSVKWLELSDSTAMKAGAQESLNICFTAYVPDI